MSSDFTLLVKKLSSSNKNLFAQAIFFSKNAFINKSRLAPMNSLSSKHILISFLAASFAFTSSLVAQPDQVLPLDPQITYGKLDNGLTYYIRENEEPKNRANFRLVVNAGSILEKESTRGLAHFLEHMAFNGTKNFEKLELVEYLESIGMRFGADLNAYTSFDETVYLLELPMDDEEIMAKGFQILEDWAHQMTFDEEEIEKERGVILEERRLRLGARNRIQDKQIPVLFHNSMYAERIPIGTVEAIESVQRADFVEFYKNYYRPDLMAIVAVGDFETENIKGLIEKHFAHLTNPEGAPARPTFEVPGHEETLFSIETDDELSSTSVSIAYKTDKSYMITEGDYRRSLAESLYSSMLNARLRERAQEKDPPYLGASTRKGSFVRAVDMVQQGVGFEEGKFTEGLKALLLENKRARDDGFTQAELERAKANRLRSLQGAFKEKDQRRSSSHAGELASHFLEQEAAPGIEYELGLTKKFLPNLSLAEVSDVGDNWMTTENRIILYTAPEKEGLQVPSQEEILAVIAEAESTKIEAYEEADLSSPLMSREPAPGSILSETKHDSVDVTEWKLSNGIRVVLKPTDFKKDQVSFTAFSPGGHSLASNEDYIPASSAAGVISNSGIGDYKSRDLRKKLAGIRAQVRPSIGELYENLSGNASPEDLETLFQLAHLRFTEPRTDEEVFSASLTQMRAAVRNRLNNPSAVFGDAVEKKLYKDHLRHQPFNEAYIDAQDLEESLEFYEDRFEDAGDFTFIFVGAFNLKTIRPLVEKYLASLPTQGRKESWKDIDDDKITGQNEVVIHKGIEPKSSVRISFYGATEWDYYDQYVMGAMIDVLKIPMREALREDKGGVYGVRVSGGMSRYPTGEFSTGISFGCDPERVEELIETALDVIRKFQAEGPDPEDLASIKEMHMRGIETSLRQNGFWMSALQTYAKNGIDFDAVNQREVRTNSLTAELIQDAAIKYFDDTNRFISKLLPEE